jgi:predicted small integral membrane protein
MNFIDPKIKDEIFLSKKCAWLYKDKMANLKKGFLPIKTNWFDRLFIGVISYIALQLLWMRFIENFISINVSIGLGLVLIFLIMWKG